MEILLFWSALALMPAVAASVKGRSFFLWFLYGLALWPVALVHILVLKEQPALAPTGDWQSQPRQPPPPRAAPTKTCPMCAETVLAAAKICRFCQHRFEAEARAPAKVDTGWGWTECRNCHQQKPGYRMVCGHCGYDVSTGEISSPAKKEA